MKENRKQALLLIIIYCLSSAILASLVKSTATLIPVTQLLFITYSVSLVLLSIVMARKTSGAQLKTNHLKLQILKGIFGALQVGLLMAALAYLPTANALILRNTSPIWVAVLCYFLHPSEAKWTSWLAIGISFVGVLIFLHPDVHQFNWGSIYALLAGISLALSSISTRVLNQKREPTQRTLFYTFLVPVLVLAAWQPGHWQAISLKQTLTLIGIGCTLFSTVYFYVRAYSFAPAAFVTPFSYITFIFAAAFDWAIWHHIPSLFALYGAAIILMGSYLNVLKATRQHNRHKERDECQRRIKRRIKHC